ncbi:hypothetical protein TYRP_006869 [Tyrophagus putrescentiae]|nr:hypothetical protein TYRP_006869 [Tyrophagus putrescentiae]
MGEKVTEVCLLQQQCVLQCNRLLKMKMKKKVQTANDRQVHQTTCKKHAALVADANSRSARFQAAGAEHVVVDGDAHCAVVVSAALAGVGQCHLAQLGRQQTGVVDGGAPAGHSQQLIVYLIASTAKTDVAVDDGGKFLYGADQGNVVLQLAGVVRRVKVHTGHAGNVAAKVVDVGVVANLCAFSSSKNAIKTDYCASANVIAGFALNGHMAHV